MPDLLNLTDQQIDEGQRAYYFLMALHAEGKAEQALKFLGSMGPAEQLAMWFGGVSVAVGFGMMLAPALDVTDIPTWFRLMGAEDDE